MEQDSLQQAIHERIEIVPYDATWPAAFERERARLATLFPQLLALEHFGSTAVPGLASKPVIDLLAAVASMTAADELIPRLCEHGYVTSAEFNATLTDRRWLMRHANGRRTHHLHLVLPHGDAWRRSLRFRDLLRSHPALAADYDRLKNKLACSFESDREAYTSAKNDFIAKALATGRS